MNYALIMTIIATASASIASGNFEPLVGIALPPLVELVNMRFKNGTVKLLISFAFSLVVACVLNYKELVPFNAHEILQDLGMIFAAAHASYKLWWENSASRVSFKNNYEKGLSKGSGEDGNLDA